MHWVRRGHLYLGLFLFPWAVLYGVTAFLFNHPSAFNDQAGTRFGKEALIGTPMETPPSPEEVASSVVAGLQKRARDGVVYTLSQTPDAKYLRNFATATARTEDGEQVSVSLDVHGAGGSLRAQSRRSDAKRPDPAPFAIGGGAMGGPRGKMGSPLTRRGSGAGRPGGGGLVLDNPLHERVKAAATATFEREGYKVGEITVSAVPDLSFRMDADGTEWIVTYNALAGTVAGRKAGEGEPSAISVRRFLLRLHLAHGYPSTMSARWGWAIIVDVMAFVMVFWGASGLLMWWQIKATRWFGVLTLAASAAVATGLTIGMYRIFTS